MRRNAITRARRAQVLGLPEQVDRQVSELPADTRTLVWRLSKDVMGKVSYGSLMCDMPGHVCTVVF